jgi:DNA-binding beta-propeller fold protein YncE
MKISFSRRSALYTAFSATAAVALAAALLGSPQVRSQSAGGGVSFAARGLLVISDADMAATAYGDAVLRRTPGEVDTLSLIDTSGAPKLAAQLPVTNSVIGWPEVLDVSPDGRFAYVAETRGMPAAGIDKYQQVYQDFPAGKFLTVVDISKLDAPRQLQQVELGVNLGAARISRDGRQLASTSDVPGKELVIATLENGLIKQTNYFALDVKRDSKSRQGARSVAWHPSGNVLAVNVADREVQFISISRNAEGQPNGVKLLGKPVLVGQTLSNGHFSKNGKFFLIPDVAWGDNAKATNFLFNGAGSVVVLAFDEAGQHSIASQTAVGLSPESLALSNDGKLIVTVNMNRTYLPDSFPASIWAKRQRSSLSLASFDEATGQVKVLQEVEFEGLLPENAVFDTQDKSLAVAIYEQRGDAQRKGQVEFWNVVMESGKPSLQATGQRITVTRGAHDLAVLR